MRKPVLPLSGAGAVKAAASPPHSKKVGGARHATCGGIGGRRKDFRGVALRSPIRVRGRLDARWVWWAGGRFLGRGGRDGRRSACRRRRVFGRRTTFCRQWLGGPSSPVANPAIRCVPCGGRGEIYGPCDGNFL